MFYLIYFDVHYTLRVHVIFYTTLHFWIWI